MEVDDHLSRMSTLPFWMHMDLELAAQPFPQMSLLPKGRGQDVSSLTQGSRNSISLGNSGRLYSCASEWPQVKDEEAGLLTSQFPVCHWLRATARALVLWQFQLILCGGQVYSWGQNEAGSCRCSQKLSSGGEWTSRASICHNNPVSSYSPAACSGHQIHKGA